MDKFNFKFKNNSIDELKRFETEVLDKIEAKSGTRRKKMFKRGNGFCEPKGSYSITYGYTSMSYLSPTRKRTPVPDKTGLYYTKLRDNHPELLNIFQEFCDLHCNEEIVVDQIQINRNWASPPHKDAGNVGESYIVGLGDYKGGETVVEYSEDHIKEYNIKNTFTKFNGSKYIHYTNTFTGTRYSLVFYQHKICSAIDIDDERNRAEP